MTKDEERFIEYQTEKDVSNTGDGDLKCEAALTLPKAGAGRSLEKRRYCIDAEKNYFFL